MAATTIGVMTRRRYRPRPDRYLVAIKLDLDTPGFAYRKWGHEQLQGGRLAGNR